MAGSFDGATFLEAAQGEGYPTWNKRDILVVKPLPAGNTPVVQEIGMDVQRLALAVIVSGTELTALYDKVLESGTLIIDWESHSAFLESIGGVTRTSVGSDLYQTTLNFIRL